MTEYSAEGWDYADLLNSDYQYRPWVVEGLFTEASQVLLAAPPNIGKSVLLQQLTHCLTNRLDFVGLTIPVPRRVLYIQSEGDLGDTVKRGHEMSKLFPAPVPGTARWEYLLLGHINTKRGRDALVALCDQFRLDNGVVIIDPLYPTLRGSMSDDSAASDYVATLNQVIHKFNSTIILCHHEHRPIRNTEGKKVREAAGESVFGSFVWQAWTSWGLQLQYTTGRAAIELVNWKRRRPTPLMDTPLAMHMVEPTPLGFIPAVDGFSRVDATVRELLRWTGVGMTVAEMTEILSVDRRTGPRRTQIQESVAKLFNLGLLDTEEAATGDRGRPATKYTLRERG